MTQAGQLILLVDDEKHLLITLSDLLTYHGYRVETAASAEAALKAIRRSRPDLIVLDISMPGMGGLGFLRVAMNDQSIAETPVLVLTARANMREFFNGVNVAGFIAKPCDKQELLDSIAAILARHAPVETETSDVDSVSVLLGEDDAALAWRIRQTLEQHGHRINVVATGPLVLDAVVSDPPDVVLMAEVLAHMNGSAVASLLRTMPTTQELPVILYTDAMGSTDRHHGNHRLTHMADQYLHTQDPKELMDAVLRQVATHRRKHHATSGSA